MAAKTFKLTAIAVALGAAAATPTAFAYEAGDIVARAGVHYVEPKSDNGDVVEVDSSFGITGSVNYFATPTVAVELLLALPFKHDISLKDGDEVGSTQHLPPTLSLVWYPAVSATVKPFVGVGLNYTMFFNEKTKGALEGTHLSLKDSVGVAAVAGVELEVNPQWGVSFDVRYFDIDTKAKVNGGSIGTVPIDPYGLGISASYRF